MTPIVSICCTSYNHENFIQKTIEGFLIQETTFPIEIIIHDDASTDKSADIIRRYATQDERIITILQEENQYSQKIKPWSNHIFPIAKGKYIALCEGDDYWTDPHKLQKQIDFLEQNEDYSICFHEVQILENDTLKENSITRISNKTTSILDIAQGNYIHTPTVVLRNDFTIPQWYNQTPLGDWTLYMLSIKNRKVKKLDDVMAVYRVHGNSVWSSKSRKKQYEGTIKAVDLLLNSDLFDTQVISLLSKHKNELLHNMDNVDQPRKKPSLLKRIIKKLFSKK